MSEQPPQPKMVNSKLYQQNYSEIDWSSSKGGNCWVCGKKVPDYKEEYCCGGTDCGCRGMPLEPCLCPGECYDSYFKK